MLFRRPTLKYPNTMEVTSEASQALAEFEGSRAEVAYSSLYHSRLAEVHLQSL